MPNWNRTDRGVTTEEEEGVIEQQGDYDGLSDIDIKGIPGGPEYSDVEENPL